MLQKLAQTCAVAAGSCGLLLVTAGGSVAQSFPEESRPTGARHHGWPNGPLDSGNTKNSGNAILKGRSYNSYNFTNANGSVNTANTFESGNSALGDQTIGVNHTDGEYQQNIGRSSR